ncbi:MAG: outer membrane protein assembly factor BamA [Candidatus Cloacimonadota bacterium]|nr:MAG: outer membrane protein assembly factor BamA [Candidatus Cloacimonadota bacterium]
MEFLLNYKKLLLFIIFPLLTANLSGERIAKIDVHGNKTTDEELIKSSSMLQVGDEITQRKLDNAIKKIYKLGLFSNVKISGEKTEAGELIIIEVEENPFLKELIFIGNDHIKEKDLKEALGIQEGEIISPQKVFKWTKKIKDKYKEKRFLLVKVSSEITREDEKAKLTFSIDEGRRVRIKNIYFTGNTIFPDKKLGSQMKNKRKRWWRSGNFDEEEFYNDLERITDLYKKKGYPKCEIKDYEISYDARQEWMTIRIDVSEGTKFFLGEPLFEGNIIIKTEVLNAAVRYKSGDVYNKEKLDDTMVEFYSLYTELGHIYAYIIPEEEIVNDTINIKYIIQEGEPAHLRKIVISGNSKTWEKVIRRELKIYPGDLFKRSKLIDSQRAVFNLGFFEDMKLDSKRANEEGDIDLILEITEKQVGQFTAGMGYSQAWGLTGNISLTIPNLLGRGTTAYFSLEKGGKLANYRFGYTEPWLFDTPTSAGFDIFFVTRKWDYFNDRKRGGTIRLGRPIPRLKYTRAYTSYTLEKVTVSVPKEYESKVSKYILDQRGTKWRSSVSFNITRDSRNYIFNATTGSKNSFTAEFSGGILGGSIDYQKYLFETRWYERSFFNFVLMIRSKFGIIDGYSSPETVPVYERFYLGGVGDWGIRGYPDRSIGPREGFSIIGGRSAFVFTLEYKYMITKGINWLIFLDAGNTWRSFRSTDLSDLKKGVGTGIRIEVPMMGILGFDIGYGFDKESYGGWTPHFQLGTSF